MKEVSGSIEAARTIAFCVQHQSRIVEDISTMFKIDSCLIRISLESRQPRKIVSEALGMFKAELKAASIELEVVSSPELAQLRIGWLLFDPSRVLQILTNLIANAIKFTGSETQGKIIVTIDAFVGEPPSRFDGIVFLPRLGKQTCSVGVDWPAEEVVYLYLSVQDAGPGLNVAEQDLLFGRFYQNTPKTHTKYGGSGLGLYISRNIAEMHGGAIGLSSEVGKGSKFAFFVKSKRTTPDETTSLTESGRTPLSLDSEGYFPSLSPENSESCYVPQEPKPKPRPPIPRSQSKKARGFLVGLKVLLVEDNILNQTVAAKQLRQRGCEVEVANHGQEALNYLRQTAFWRATEPGRALSVVLLDVEMPVMGGLACIRRIRELQSSGDIQGHVPVIAVTANARPGQIAEALKAGMVRSFCRLAPSRKRSAYSEQDHVTTKPYRIDDLLEQIERIVENAD
jgi:CheY-like chemotaxis protein